MTKLRLRAYYRYDGPKSANPLRTELSSDEVIRNLELLPDHFIHTLEESASVNVTREDYSNKEIEIEITADCDIEKLREITEDILKQNDLYGDILEE